MVPQMTGGRRWVFWAIRQQVGRCPMDSRDRDDPMLQRRKRKKRRPNAPGAAWLIGAVVLVLVLAGTLGLLWAAGVFKPQETTPPSSLLPESERPQNRFVGYWEHIPRGLPGSRMTLDVSEARRLTVTAIHPGKSLAEDAAWEVLSEKKDRLRIRIRFMRGPSEWDIELLPNDEMRVNFLTSRSSPVVYRRTARPRS
jgi:hypothetical protein